MINRYWEANMIDTETFSETTEEQANEAQALLDRYADARDKILDNTKRIIAVDLTTKDTDFCLAAIKEALDEAYYTLERDLREQVRDYECRDNGLHQKLERMGL